MEGTEHSPSNGENKDRSMDSSLNAKEVKKPGFNTFVFLYAIICGLLNFSLPVIDSLSKKTLKAFEKGIVEHELFLEVFHLSQYGVSIICIIVLTSIIGKSRSSCCRCCEKSETKKSIETDDDEERTAPLATPESGRVKVRKPSSPADSFVVVPSRTDGVNLYLRLGALAFGFGAMIYDGFKISDMIHVERHECSHSHLWIPKYSTHFLFIFLQTFFIVKHFNYNFDRYYCVSQFCLVQLVITNIGQWFKVVTYEISEGVMSHSKANSTEVEGTECSGLSKMLSPFLFPCIIEYSIIASAIAFRLLRLSLGLIHHSGHLPPKPLSLSIQAINQRYNECHRAYKGLFVGLLLLMLTLVSMAVFFLFSKQLHTITTFRVYQITETGLLGVTLIAAMWGLLCIRSLHRFSYRVVDMEIGLLCLGFVGVFFHDLLILVPAIPRAVKMEIEGVMFIVSSGVEMLQSIIQVLLIIEGQRRCSSSVEEVRRKRGRTVITFLLLSNLALWLVNTFEVKYVVEESFQAEYYNKTAWGILSRILLPLMIFFRFHSSVCLSAIWTDVYKLRE